MKRHWLLLGTLMNIACSAAPLPTPLTHQSVTLGNERFQVQIILDNSDLIPTYGPRFDLTARVQQVTLDKHTYLSVNGLIDEFGITGVGTLGYNQAKPGENFLKIGVGVLQRLTNKPYQFDAQYPIQQRAAASIASNDDGGITITQEATLQNIAYRYTKQYQVVAERHELSITYEFTNTGATAIAFDQYNHDWFHLDPAPIAPQDILTLPLPLTSDLRDWLQADGSRLRPAHPVVQPSYQPAAAAVPAAQNRWLLQHLPTGKTVVISGDFPSDRQAYYAQPDALCPEIFFTATLQPGAKISWQRTYRFQ